MKLLIPLSNSFLKRLAGKTVSVRLFFLSPKPSALHLASPVDQISTQIFQVPTLKKQQEK